MFFSNFEKEYQNNYSRNLKVISERLFKDNGREIPEGVYKGSLKELLEEFMKRFLK